MTPSLSDLPTHPVHLTDEEARLFIAFQKRRAFMELMESIEAFDIKGGSVVIHFDNLGGIATVDVQRKYKVIPS